MLGKQIRSFNHLLNLCKKAKTGLRIMHITHHGFGVEDCYAFPIVNHIDGEVVILSRGMRKYAPPASCYEKVSEECKQKVYDLESKGYTAYTIYSRSDMGFFSPFRFVVDNDIEEKYKEFIANNKKIIESINSKYLESESLLSKFLFLATEGNATFFAWAAKAVTQFRMSLHALLHIMDFNSKHSVLIKKLTKQNIIALGNTKEILDALWESFHLRAEAVANKTVSIFNPAQKKILKEKLSDPHAIQLLNNFNKLSMKKKTNFVRKVSTIEDASEILKMMAFVCTNSHFSWNQEAFHEFIKNVEGLRYKVVYEKPNLTVLQVFDFETVKRLGKMTNWCISKNKSYWNQYVGTQELVDPFDFHNVGANDDNVEEDIELGVDALTATESEDENTTIKLFDPEDIFLTSKKDDKSLFFRKLLKNDGVESTLSKNKNNKQFMVFDFSKNEDDKLSIVGITVDSRKGITNAHNFINENMLGRRGGLLGVIGEEILPLPPEYFGFSDFLWFESVLDSQKRTTSVVGEKLEDDPRSIKTFIKIRQIDPNLFNEYHDSKFEWNREGLFDFINKFMDEEDYDVIYESDDEVLLSTQNPRIGGVMDNSTMYPLVYRGIGLEKKMTKYHDSNPKTFWYFDFTKPSNDVNKTLVYFIYEENGGNRTIERPTAPINVIGNTVVDECISFNDLLFKLELPYDIIKRPDSFNSKLTHFIRTDNYGKIHEYIKSEPDKEISGRAQYLLTDKLINTINNLHTFELYDVIMSLDRPLVSILGKKGLRNVVSSLSNRLMSLLWDSKKDQYKFFTNKKEVVNYIEDMKSILDRHFDEFQNRRNRRGMTNHRGSDINTMAFSLSGNMILYAITNILERAYKEGGNDNIISFFLNDVIANIPHHMQMRYHSPSGPANTDNNFVKELIDRYSDRWNCIDTNVLRGLFYITAKNNNFSEILESRIDLFFATTTPKLKNAFGPITNLMNLFINGNDIPKEAFMLILGMINKSINKHNYLTEDEKEIVKKTIKEKLCASKKVV